MALRFLAVLVLLIAAGCADRDEPRTVDFSRTVKSARPETPSHGNGKLRVAVAAMVSPKEAFVYYHQLLDYIGGRLGRDIQLIQRKTYAEVRDLLGKGQIDLAFLCSGPYALETEDHGCELVATPEVNGSHFYKAYLIVNAKGSLKSLEDLRGKTFAFTDPDSNTGKLVPTSWLEAIGETPKTFFSKTIYTYSHDNSIMAVSKGLVDGASVDSLIWDYYRRKKPALTSTTRIIRKSEPYGIPPVVVSRSLARDTKDGVRRVLFAIHQDEEGRKILANLMIDRFIEPQDAWYDSIRAMRGKPNPR
ncbi:MAG: phosphate/phosphite/phosphonate ABC transporter substrate-binding protein [Thermodesulfobacteriota bacterium]